MNRRKWIVASLLALPFAVAGGLVYGNSQPRGYTCPVTGETLPCEKCCQLNDRQQGKEESYTCPLTGEQLDCPNCCPLNKGE